MSSSNVHGTRFRFSFSFSGGSVSCGPVSVSASPASSSASPASSTSSSASSTSVASPFLVRFRPRPAPSRNPADRGSRPCVEFISVLVRLPSHTRSFTTLVWSWSHKSRTLRAGHGNVSKRFTSDSGSAHGLSTECFIAKRVCVSVDDPPLPPSPDFVTYTECVPKRCNSNASSRKTRVTNGMAFVSLQIRPAQNPRVPVFFVTRCASMNCLFGYAPFACSGLGFIFCFVPLVTSGCASLVNASSKPDQYASSP